MSNHWDPAYLVRTDTGQGGTFHVVKCVHPDDCFVADDERPIRWFATREIDKAFTYCKNLATAEACNNYAAMGRVAGPDGDHGDPKRCYTCGVMPDRHALEAL